MKCVLIDARDRDPAARELLDDHRVGRQIEPHAAVLLGDRHAEQPQLLHLLDDRLGERVLVVVVLGVRQDLLVGELVHHLGDRLLLVGLLGVRRGGYGHADLALQRSCWRSRGPEVGWLHHARENTGVNFAARRRSTELPPRRDCALVELARDGVAARVDASARSPSAAARLAGALRARGVGRGDVVMTLIGNRPEWVLSDVRLLSHRRGRAAVHRAAARERPAPAHRRGAAVADRRRRAQPRASSRPAAPGAARRSARARARRGAVRRRARARGRAGASEDPCLITFTSGTAGEPKAVLHAQRYLDGQRLQATHWLGARRGRAGVVHGRRGWSKSARNVFIAPWLSGASALLHDARFDPHERLELLRARARERAVHGADRVPRDRQARDAAARCRTCARWSPPARR